MEKILEENRRLKEENEMLKRTLERKLTSGSMSAYETIRSMIFDFVNKEVEKTTNGKQRSNLRRKIIDDMKWDLRVRTINDFKVEDISRAKEYLENYKIDEYYYMQEVSQNGWWKILGRSGFGVWGSRKF